LPGLNSEEQIDHVKLEKTNRPQARHEVPQFAEEDGQEQTPRGDEDERHACAEEWESVNPIADCGLRIEEPDLWAHG
jgi:hypothetical protein